MPKNHLGEPEYQTYAGWKVAIKKRFPNATFDGDRDIAQALVGGKGVGEWDGAVGCVYSPVKEAVDPQETFGFAGTISQAFPHVSRAQARELYDYAASLFDDQDRAREFLNTQSGRYLADALTFMVDAKTGTVDELKKALAQKEHKEISWFFRRFQKFTPQVTEESAAAKIVNSLLAEDDPRSIMPKRNLQRELASMVALWVAGKASIREVETELKSMGVIPRDVKEAHVEPGSAEHGVIHVFLHRHDGSDSVLTVDQDGSTWDEDPQGPRSR